MCLRTQAATALHPLSELVMIKNFHSIVIWTELASGPNKSVQPLWSVHLVIFNALTNNA